MSIKIGNTNISKIYCGSTRIKKIYVGSTLVYSSGIFTKMTNISDVVEGIAVDDEYVYVSCGTTSTTAPKFYKINKTTNEITQLTHPLSYNYYVRNIHCNNTLVLFMNTRGDYVWYNKSTNTFSSVYDDGGDHINSCCMDDTYTYFGVISSGNIKLKRITNNSQTTQTFSSALITSAICSMVVDNNYVYMYTADGACYTFNKTNNEISLFAGAPSSGISISYNYTYKKICQNSTYVFQQCEKDDANNYFLVTDKINKTTSLIQAMTEMVNGPEISCNEQYLYLSYSGYIAIYKLAKGFDKYTIESMDKYTESTSTNRIAISYMAADNANLYLATVRPYAVFKYTE